MREEAKLIEQDVMQAVQERKMAEIKKRQKAIAQIEAIKEAQLEDQLVKKEEQVRDMIENLQIEDRNVKYEKFQKQMKDVIEKRHKNRQDKIHRLYQTQQDAIDRKVDRTDEIL